MKKHIYRFIGVSCATVCTGCTLRQITRENQVWANSDCSTSNETAASAKSNDADLLSVSSSMSLKNVQIIFRHGARTPIHIIPKIDEVTYTPRWFSTSPGHTSYSYQVTNLYGGPRQVSPLERSYRKRFLKGGLNVGQLTNTGEEQAYMFGKQLQKEYINQTSFISSKYNPKEIYLRSTNTERTIGSLRSILAGIFGKEELMRHAPIRFLVADAEKDILLPRVSVCKVLRLINHFAMIHHESIPEIKENWKVIEELLGLGEKDRKSFNFIDVRDDLIARKTHGFPVPPIFTPHLDMIEKYATKLMSYAFCGHKQEERETALKLSSGSLVDFLLTNLDEAVSNKSRYKLRLLSAHDSTLVALLSSLDIFDDKWPPFCADVRLELYEDDTNQHFVKVKYLGKDTVVRGCQDTLCPLSQFKNAMEKLAVKDNEYVKLCNSDILRKIGKDILEQEKGEVEDKTTKSRSDVPAGM